MDLKVGDLVIIRQDLKQDEIYGRYVVVEDMMKYTGKTARIVDIHVDYYSLCIDKKRWKWAVEMLEDGGFSE